MCMVDPGRNENSSELKNQSVQSSHRNIVHARISASRSEASAAVQSRLGFVRSAAIQAALLAPAQEAIRLAVLGSILTIGGIALGATRGHTDFACEASVELVMIEIAGHNVVSTQSTVGASFANNSRI